MKKQGPKESPGNKTESKKDKSTDTGNDLPGYPHYPASEDIMNSSDEKLGLDIENPEAPIIENKNNTLESSDGEIELIVGTSADVTIADLKLLEDELAMDLGDDESLRQRLYPVDMEAKDLVVPGAELDDVQEEIGSEDEENNFYSRSDN